MTARDRQPATIAAVVALGALAYANALPGTFHFDDAHAIVENPTIRSFRFAGRWLTDVSALTVLPENQDDWRPMVLAANALSYWLGGGLSPLAFHLTNLAIHLACAVLVWLIGRQLLAAELPAFLAAAIFAVHPLQSEVVNYAYARGEGLAALGILAAFYCHLRGRTGLSLAWFAFGLSAKAVAIVVPALVYVHDGFLAGEPWLRLTRQRLARYGGYALLAAGYLGLRWTLIPDFAVRSRSNATRLAYALTQVRGIWHYLGLYVWPVGQSADADYPLTTSPLEPRFALALAASLALLSLCVAFRKRARLPIFGLAWLLIVLAPTSSLFPLPDPVNEHRPYAALAGLAWATVWLAAQLARRLGTMFGTEQRLAWAGLLLVPLLALTWRRNAIWRDDLSLWSDVAAKAPGNGRAHLNLGLALARAGRLDEAREEYDACARAWPRYAYCPLDKGELDAALGKKPEALAEYREAERLNPLLFWIPFYEGKLLRTMDLPASKQELARAVALSPGFPAAHRELAATLLVLGERDAARSELDRALALDPADAETLRLRGVFEATEGALPGGPGLTSPGAPP